MQKGPPVYFRKTRPPWLSTTGSAEDPTIQIERLAFFGWLWEPYHSPRLTLSSKYDKAVIDLSLGEFGGDTT